MASKTAAVLIILAIFASFVANVAEASSNQNNYRKLLSSTQTVTWGSHHSGEASYGDGLLGLLTPVLGGINVYVNADLSVACIDLLWADLSLLGSSSLLTAFVDLPLHPSTGCSLLNLGAYVSLKLNQGLVAGLLGTLLGTVEKVVELITIWADNEGPLLYIKISTSSGHSHAWGNPAAVGIQLKLDISDLLSLKTCRYEGLVSLITARVVV